MRRECIRSLLRRTLTGFCCAAFLLSLLSGLDRMTLAAKSGKDDLDTKIEQLKDELKEAEEARKEASEAYEQAKGDYQDLKKRKEAIDRELDAMEREAEALRSMIVGYAEQEARLNRRIATMESELDRLMETVKDRLRLDYEEGRADFFTLLFTSNGLYEFLTSLERLSLLAEQDRDQIRQCEEAGKALKAEKETLANVVATADETQRTLHQAMTDLEAKQRETLKMMEDLQKDADAYLKALEQAEKEEEAFQKELEEKLKELAESGQPSQNTGALVWPLPTKYDSVSSRFGNRIHPVTGKPQFHEGIDIPAPNKTEIYACGAGTVIETGSHYANGKYVIVDHGGGITTMYAHLSRIGVNEGDTLKKGEVLGLVGITGWATGYHLHFSLYKDGKAVDPLLYLPN